MSNARCFVKSPHMPSMAILLFTLSFLLTMPFAQTTASPSTFTWENYKGFSQWRVQVTLDDTACGAESPTTASRDLTITHDLKNVNLGDLGHGPVTGTMTGNILHLPARTIDDPPGSSVLSAFDATFASDCSSFSARYRWDYTSQYQQCSGTTSYRGTRTGASGCPGPLPGQTTTPPTGPTPEELNAQLQTANSDFRQVRDLYYEARLLNAPGYSSDLMQSQYQQDKREIEALEPRVEQQYKDILKADPDNFWANWGMGELRKTQGDATGYLNYLSKAVDDNQEMYERTRQELKKQAMEDMGLTKMPDAVSSPTVNRLVSETDGWTTGSIGDIMVTKPDNPSLWRIIFPTSISQRVTGLFDRAAGFKQAE